MGATKTNYRPDIDGLRAVAILSVVGFHVGLKGFPGGFVGVDVFFVISGFLITSLLIEELRQRGTIDLIAFFARRARRLLPAFFLVVAATLLLAYFFLVPADDEQKRFAKSVVAAVLYAANWHFAWVGSGYFDAPSSLYPMLHTWSLAVEEQFYLIWPLMLLGAAWVAARSRLSLMWLIAVMLVLVLVASTAYSWHASSVDDQTARFAFFALPSRAWELAVGASLALALALLGNLKSPFGAVLTAAGLAAIMAATITFHEGSGFPSETALLPTLGAAAIIAGGWLSPQGKVTELLASRPLVAIGLVSYSWYLWHWPLLAIARAHALGTEDQWRDGAIAIASLGLAALTYTFIEDPIRRRQVAADWSNIGTIGAAALCSFALIVTAQALGRHSDRAARRPSFTMLQQAQDDTGWSGKRCYRNSNAPYGGLIAQSECMESFESNRKVLVVWGDSHADHLIGMFEAADVNHHFALLSRPQGLCPPLANMVPGKNRRPFELCARFNRDVLGEIIQLQEQSRLAAVVLSAHWALYLDRPKLAGGEGVAIWRNGRWSRNEAAAEAIAEGLSGTIHALTDRGIKVLVVAPMPEQRFRVPSCLARRSIKFCSVTRSVAEEHRTLAFEAIKRATNGLAGVYVWDPLPALCDRNICLAERDGLVMYRDGDHLTYGGSRWLGAYFEKSPAWSALVNGEGKNEPEAYFPAALSQPR